MLALGDIVERTLTFFGITKERVKAVTGKQDCGCANRQAAMNRAGFRVQRFLLTLLYRFVYTRMSERFVVAFQHFYMACRVLFYGR